MTLANTEYECQLEELLQHTNNKLLCSVRTEREPVYDIVRTPFSPPWGLPEGRRVAQTFSVFERSYIGRRVLNVTMTTADHLQREERREGGRERTSTDIGILTFLECS